MSCPTLGSRAASNGGRAIGSHCRAITLLGGSGRAATTLGNGGRDSATAKETNQKLWKTIVDLVECDDMRDVFALALCASASIQSIERSSLSHERKHNSFLGRWFGTDHKKGKKNDQN